MSKALVVFSGGQDSTTCLYWAMSKYRHVHAITFDYGQRHQQEIAAAIRIAEIANLRRHEVVVFPVNILHGTSPLVNRSAKVEQYENWDKLPGGLEKTFVPMRNALFLTIAANRAYEEGITDIVTGVSAEDYGGYPDCRLSFINSMQKMIQEATEWNELLIHTPLMGLTKKETVELALGMDGCYEALAYSHTAYDDAYPPTGKDHATLLRAKGFAQAGVPDPLLVRAYWEQALPQLPDTTPLKQEIYELTPRDPRRNRGGVLLALSALRARVRVNKWGADDVVDNRTPKKGRITE